MRFPKHDIPVSLSNDLILSKENFRIEAMIKGKKYIVSKSPVEIRIKYRVNDPLEVFILVFIQISVGRIAIDENPGSHHKCEVGIEPLFKFLFGASVLIFGIICITICFHELIVGAVFFLFTGLIAFIQFKMTQLAINYLSHKLKDDMSTIINFVEQSITIPPSM